MKRILILIFFGILGCNSKAQENTIVKDITINQKIPKYDTTIFKSNLKHGEVASFYYSNEYTDTHPPFFISAKDSSNISAKDSSKKIIIRYPTLMIDATQQIPFLVYPGEKIIVNVGKDNFSHLSLDGNEERNNELNFFLALHRTKDFIIQNVQFFLGGRNNKIVAKNKFDFAQWDKNSTGIYNSRKKFLIDYRSHFKISNQFVQYVETFFKYAYYLQLTAPIYLSNIDSLPDSYYHKIDSLATNFYYDSCVLNPAYQWSAISLLEYFGRDFRFNSRKFSLLYDTTSKLFADKTRRFIHFMQLKRNMNLMPEDYMQVLDIFKKEGKDIYSDYLLENEVIFDSSVVDENNALLGANSIKTNWSELLKKYKGKVLYIDFWASWCVPCRKSIPYSVKLGKTLMDKNFHVIFISLDEEMDKWKKGMREHGIDTGYSFLIPNLKTSEIIKRFKINSIPRYLIIGKNGEIISDDAPSPEDKNLKERIERIESGN